MHQFRPIFLLLALSLVACSNKQDKAEPTPAAAAAAAVEASKDEPIKSATPPAAETPATTDSPTCKEQAAELRTFLTAVFDENAQVEAPWPTGDEVLDAKIEDARAEMREVMKKDPTERMPLLKAGVDTSADEEMYRDCPEGLAALQAVGTTVPDKRRAAMTNIADGVEACDCKVEMGWLKASLYMGQRGPE